MKTDIWMPLYIGDYLADTQHLTPEKHGIYLLLMMHYWKQGPLENDLEELCCVTRASEEKLVRILKEFFTLEDGFWTHNRIDKERAKAFKNRETARINGKKGGRPRNPEKTQGLTQEEPNENPGVNPETNPTPNPEKTSSSSPLSSNSEEKNSAPQKKVKPQKHKYGEYQNVLLSEEEYQKLVEAWGEKEAKIWIETLSQGMAMKSYKYKSHYLAIRNWRKREHPEQDISKISATAPAPDHIKPWEDVGEKSLQELHGAVRRSG